MKGVIFNLLEEVVTNAHGNDAWDELLDYAGLDGVYTSLGNYHDGELLRLVDAASVRWSLPADDVLRWAGRQTVPLMAGRWPEYFALHASTEPFLRSLNSVIHPEIRKLYAGAHCPHFEFGVRPDDGALLLGYRSPRRLCGFAHGLVAGAADHYGEAVVLDHLQCMHRGDARCLISVCTGLNKRPG